MQQEMKYIYQVYTDGSFSRAAEHLYLTQPALSIAVQKVEESIGMPLFDRSRRPLQLTAAGEIYIGTIKKIMGLEQDLDRQIQDIQNLAAGEIRLGGSHYLNAYILPGVLSGNPAGAGGGKLRCAGRYADRAENRPDIQLQQDVYAQL